MTSVVVVSISENEIELGYAGQVRSIRVINKCISWLDTELTVYRMVRSWFHDVLLNNPSTCKVVISEPMWISRVRKQRLCEALFVKFRVHSICFVPNCLTAFIGAGIRNGIFVEVSSNRTEVMPIYEGRMLDNYSRTSTIGSQEKDLVFLLMEDEASLDIDQRPLVPLVHSAIDSLPCDIRTVLGARIVDNSSLTIRAHEEKYFSVVETLGCWAGGSLYACNLFIGDLHNPLEVKLSQYEDKGTIPDWHSNKFCT